jgi:hypothetical protein
MNPAVAHPQTSTVIMTALLTLPLLMPGARRRYGTLPVVLGVLALSGEVFSWIQARRSGPTRELAATMHDPDIASSPHLRTHLE